MSSGQLQILTLELGAFAAHCLIVADRATSEAVVVDPGLEAGEIVARLKRERLEPVAIVLTHAHLDHASGVAEVKRAFPAARVLLHPGDLPLYSNLPGQSVAFGFPVPEVVPEDGLLADGDRVRVGAHELVVRHTPGHSPGHVVLVHERAEDPFVIVGDVLFAGGVGRTDLWGGSWPELERSIRTVLYALPDGTRVIPGHGEETTIGMERESNPFVSG